MRKNQLLFVCTIVASLLLVTGTAIAVDQPIVSANTLLVDYFANANTTGAPDATVRITNPGTSFETLCADIYVFYTDQEMAECCACAITPDGLLTLSVNSDLTSNPLTSNVPVNGVIKIVSSYQPTGCNATKVAPTPTLRAWSTHIQNTSYTITEEESQQAPLSAAEAASLDTGCGDIVGEGSGHGICTCGSGGRKR
jgi:hypothetical protein